MNHHKTDVPLITADEKRSHANGTGMVTEKQPKRRNAMGLFDFMKRGQSEINKAVEKLKGEPLAVLLDVREPGEFQGGHIPGSINIPVGNLSANNGLLPDKSAPIYVYCQSGARSSRAEKILKTAGFTNVTNIGGIMSYRGPLE